MSRLEEIKAREGEASAGPWRCAVCGGETSDARIFYRSDGREEHIHRFPYKAPGHRVMCDFVAAWNPTLHLTPPGADV